MADPAAGRASAYGLEGIIADGQDADVVYRTAKTAFDKARAGGGPSLIEFRTYRYSGHSRADPAKYRPAGELDHWKQNRDPITIYRQRLLDTESHKTRSRPLRTKLRQSSTTLRRSGCAAVFS